MNNFDNDFWKMASTQGSSRIIEQKQNKKRNHRKWLDNYKMKSVGVIKAIDNQKSKKRFTITFDYEDDKGKLHKASVRFGMKDKMYLVDSGDQQNAKIFSQSCRNLKNPFHHNYWEMYILNTCKTIQEAHARYRIQNNLL